MGNAVKRREDNSYRKVKTITELKEIMDGPGGYVYTGWCGDPAVELAIKEQTGATLRCIPEEEFRSAKTPHKCIGRDQKSEMEVVWAKAY